jgi:hypothetical protein
VSAKNVTITVSGNVVATAGFINWIQGTGTTYTVSVNAQTDYITVQDDAAGGGGGTAATTTFTPAGTLAADDVQEALEELDSDITGLRGIDYLVGTATALTSGEIVVGTSPGGELGGTWASPTVDATHSGSTHAAAVTTHEAASDPHTGYRLESADHTHATTGLQGGTLAASAIVFTPDGSIAATNVQAAIVEVRDEAGGGGAVATDAIWDAKGDLAAGTGADTAAKVTVGANDTMLMAASGQSTGVKWGTPAEVMAALQAIANGLPKICRCSGDSTCTNSTTLQDITGLSFAIAANEVWFVEAYLMGTNGAAGATADWKFGWTVPASCTADWGGLQVAGATIAGWGVSTAATGGAAILAVGSTFSIGGVNSARQAFSVGGIFTNSSTPGTVQLQFAQNTQTNENTIIRQLNSFLRVTRLG